MSVLTVRCFPDPLLRKPAQAINDITPEIMQLAADLTATLYHENLIGIAATHAGVLKQMIVIDISAERNQPQLFINPKIIEQHGNELGKEGGIAMPGIEVDVARATHIKMTALNLQGETIILEAEGLLARVLQHEIDQMNGKLFIDGLSAIKRERAIEKFKKLQRQGGCAHGCDHHH